MMSDSDDDWFTKDEEKIVQSLQEHVKQQQQEDGDFIEADVSLGRHFSLEYGAFDASCVVKSAARFTTAELAETLKKAPIDMFLYYMTGRDLFELDQLVANDSQKRLLLFVKTFRTLSELELDGFNQYYLWGFSKQAVLMDMVKRLILRLLARGSKGKCDADSELLLKDVKWLSIRAHKFGVFSEQGYELMDLYKKMVAEETKLPQLLKRELSEELEVFNTNTLAARSVKNEIYPTIEILLQSDNSETTTSIPSPLSNKVADYLNNQRQLLRNDFVAPLVELVQRLKNQTDLKRLEKQGLLWPHTRLLLNPDVSEEKRHNLVLLDIKPKDRAKNCARSTKANNLESNFLDNVKTGALLCFTTSYDFDNLLLATGKYTEPSKLKEGYLSVEIVKQENIGNIYEKPLIMFPAPVFFEPYLRVHNYLSTCSADKFPMRRYIVDKELEPQAPAYIKPEATLIYNAALKNPPQELPFNDTQRNAFKAALNSEFCLIQGPPGTGKTHVSGELVKVLIQNAKHLNTGPVIVLTYTNDSLDKFLLKATKYTDQILRFGNQTRNPQIAKYNVRHVVNDDLVPPRLKRVWWLIKSDYKEQFQRLQTELSNFDGSEEAYQKILAEQLKLQEVGEKLDTLQIIFQYFLARGKELIAMTTTCAARLNFLFRLLKSKCVVFEEAAEIQEAHILACLTPYTEHVILVGDHKQLQPYTGYSRLPQVSLFERLINGGFPVSVLKVQYRMRPNIARLLVPSFYDELLCSDSVNAYENVRGLGSNLFFVKHDQPEQQLSDMSWENPHEAMQLVNLTEFLIKRVKYLATDIVILSPYNRQVEKIKKMLPKYLQNDVRVASVDSFQGLESNIVLLSLVRSNAAGEIGFLRQANRVCVALSRARWALYIIGNMETLQRGNRKLWGAIFQQLEAAMAIGNAFPLCEADDD